VPWCLRTGRCVELTGPGANTIFIAIKQILTTALCIGSVLQLLVRSVVRSIGSRLNES
jgi:hypothetical protein